MPRKIKQLGEDIWDLGDEMTGQLKGPSLSILLFVKEENQCCGGLGGSGY